MDWTQTLTIIISMLAFIGGAFLFLNSKIDKLSNDLTKEIQDVRNDLTKEIQDVRNDLTKMIQDVRNDLIKEIQKNREDILWIKFRIDPHEHYKYKSLEEEIKEN